MTTPPILCMITIISLVFLIYTIYDDFKVDKEKHGLKYKIGIIFFIMLCVTMLGYGFYSLHISYLPESRNKYYLYQIERANKEYEDFLKENPKFRKDKYIEN